ncbi:hypothetical protein AMATHDRAFT_68779 [Amanita thiersii Skay4041]|uniref:Uncharacterized protein n=1 Tax=Amanita thiersii Skay4041 TaxID=703135 RepID=A0A2A9N896_9AGAR|nr:hypothetical protein AMATHDRAFT_68779 [Amanita thiersii Skay4041]
MQRGREPMLTDHHQVNYQLPVRKILPLHRGFHSSSVPRYPISEQLLRRNANCLVYSSLDSSGMELPANPFISWAYDASQNAEICIYDQASCQHLQAELEH